MGSIRKRRDEKDLAKQAHKKMLKDRLKVRREEYRNRVNKPRMGHTYSSRNENLRRLGFHDYKEYLVSELWAEIRERAFQLKGRKCLLCLDRDASQVHHLGYGMAVLRGESLSQLIPVCYLCHQRIEFCGTRKRTLLEAHRVYNYLVRESKKKRKSSGEWYYGICKRCRKKAKKGLQYCRVCKRKTPPT